MSLPSTRYLPTISIRATFAKTLRTSTILWVARATTILGVALSIGTAYLATHFNNIMDFLQLVFGFVNAPLFATFLLGMFWKRTTGHAAFTGLLAGPAAAAITHGLTMAERKGGWITTLRTFPSTMAQNFWIAIYAWSTCLLLTIVISMVTKPKPETGTAQPGVRNHR